MLADAAPLAIRSTSSATGDIAAFDQPHDLVFSNAALQWLGDHGALFPDLAALVKPGGCLAVQMASNFYAQSHALLTETAKEGPWARKLANGWRPLAVEELDWYVRLFGRGRLQGRRLGNRVLLRAPG